MKCRAL